MDNVFKTVPHISQVHYIFFVGFFWGFPQLYIFGKAIVYYKESENQCLCGGHIEFFLKKTAVKLKFVISLLLNKMEC